MTSETIFHLIEIAFQILGFGVLIFKGGKYLGQTNEMFLGLFRNLKRIEDDFTEHKHEDDRKHEQVTHQLTNIRVEVAGITRADVTKHG